MIIFRTIHDFDHSNSENVNTLEVSQGTVDTSLCESCQGVLMFLHSSLKSLTLRSKVDFLVNSCDEVSGICFCVLLSC